jgi:hypothetical protein
LIKPWTTCLRVILPVMSTAWPGSFSGGRCSRDWCGRRRAMFVVMPRVLGQDPPELPLAVDQQVVMALAP